MKKIILFLAVILVIPVVLSVFPNSSSSTTYQANLTLVVSGSGNLSSTNYNTQVNVAEYVVGNSSGSTYNLFFGFPFGTEEEVTTGLEPASANITIFSWNGSNWVSGENVAFSSCTIGSNFCEPDNQNFTGNQTILNITSSGDLAVSTIDFRINQTCSWLNLTFANSTNLTGFPRTDLNDTYQPLYGPLAVGDSFGWYLWANVSVPTVGCVLQTEYDVN